MSQGLVDIIRGHTLSRQSSHFVDLITILREKKFKRIRQEKEKARAVGISSNRNLERLPRKYYRCGSEDHMIAKCPKPPKDSEKQRKSVRFN